VKSGFEVPLSLNESFSKNLQEQGKATSTYCLLVQWYISN